MKMHFLLYQNQIWINRKCILQYLNKEIEDLQKINDPTIPTKIKFLEFIKEKFSDLNPNNADEEI